MSSASSSGWILLFSAELLRFANSALFSVSREVTSLAQAIMIVGTDRIKTMATLVAVNRMVRTSVRIEALRKVWIHSLVTALSRKKPPERPAPIATALIPQACCTIWEHWG